MHYGWPGNVRELQNEIERAVALAPDGETIGTVHLSPRLGGGPGVAPALAGADRGSLRRARTAFEAIYIAQVLRQHGGNVSRAAQTLGLSRVMLQRKMKVYRLR